MKLIPKKNTTLVIKRHIAGIMWWYCFLNCCRIIQWHAKKNAPSTHFPKINEGTIIATIEVIMAKIVFFTLLFMRFNGGFHFIKSLRKFNQVFLVKLVGLDASNHLLRSFDRRAKVFAIPKQVRNSNLFLPPFYSFDKNKTTVEIYTHQSSARKELRN